MARTLRRIVFGLIGVIALAAFALWRVDNPRVERFRMALADALTPSLDLVAGPLSWARRSAEDWRGFLDAHEENRELLREIARLRAWREAAQELERENARLRALNNVRLAPRVGFATGEVIADSGGPFAHSVLVDVGAADGVEDGAAVVDGGGLVGRVVGVGERVARVLLLTDPSSRAPVAVMPSGRRAILVGDGESAPRLGFLADPQGVSIGDRVVTTGDGGVLPPGLDVGVIGSVGDRAARVRLAAEYRRFDFVRVLRWSREAPLDEAPGLVGEPPAEPYGPPMPPETAQAAAAEVAR